MYHCTQRRGLHAQGHLRAQHAFATHHPDLQVRTGAVQPHQRNEALSGEVHVWDGRARTAPRPASAERARRWRSGAGDLCAGASRSGGSRRWPNGRSGGLLGPPKDGSEPQTAVLERRFDRCTEYARGVDARPYGSVHSGKQAALSCGHRYRQRPVKRLGSETEHWRRSVGEPRPSHRPAKRYPKSRIHSMPWVYAESMAASSVR